MPLVALLWAGQVGHDTRATGANLLAVAVVCGAAGVAWQLLHRRDLVDRLTHFASAFTVLAILFGVAWGSPVRSSIGGGVGLAAVLTGLVYTEQYLRSRDWRRAQRGARSGSDQAHSLPVA
jgi:hypothetical protein